jgi:HlyD family secretion protein
MTRVPGCARPLAGACGRLTAGGIAALTLTLAGCGQPPDQSLPGYIEGEYVRIAAPYAGTLQQLSVRRGDRVVIGAPLFALEREAEAAARREAQAKERAATARLANLQSGRRPPEVESVAQQLRRAQSARDLSAANLKRQQELARSGFVSPASLDDYRAQLRGAEAEVASLQSQVATANLPARPDEIHAAEADARAAAEALAQSDWRLGQRVVTAPVAGLVHDTYYLAGEFVPAGSPVASLLPLGNVKARFYVAEPVAGRLQRGDRIELRCDGCGAPIAATIDFISDRVEFTPPVLYSKENRAKLAFLIEARPAAADAVRLKPGQPVDVMLPR